MEKEENNSVFVVDFDYEFDANTFFDFTRPESVSEAYISETWFCNASTYPPSPFIVKFKWREEMYSENSKASFKSNCGESVISSIKNSDSESNGNREGTRCDDEFSSSMPKTKVRSGGNSSGIRSSTFMKPTASHLAKLKAANEVYSNRSLERSRTSVTGSSDQSSKSSPISVHQNASKRQKLDIGYLLKVARQKHKNLLLHKLSKVPNVVANNVSSRPKPTIPKEPELETAHRAQRHRSRNNPEIDINAKLKPSGHNEQAVNKKIFKTSPFPPQTKLERPSPNFQRTNTFDAKSMDAITDNKRLNFEKTSKQEKSELTHRSKVRPLNKQKPKNPVQNRSLCSPPTDLFKKLSLKPEVVRSAKQQFKDKVPKENVPSSFRQEISVS